MKEKIEFLCIKTVHLNDNPKKPVLYHKGERYKYLGSRGGKSYPVTVKDEQNAGRSLSLDFLQEHFAV